MTHTVDTATLQFYAERRLACKAVEAAWLANAPADELQALKAHRDQLLSIRRSDMTKKPQYTIAAYTAALHDNPDKTSDEVRAMFEPAPEQTYAERQANLDKPKVKNIEVTTSERNGRRRIEEVHTEPKLNPSLRRKLRKAGFNAPYGDDAFAWLKNN